MKKNTKLLSHSHRLDALQEEVLSITIPYLKAKKIGFIKLPTGCGKTRLAIKIAMAMSARRVLWLTKGRELLSQTALEVISHGHWEKVSRFDGYYKGYDADFLVASVSTMGKISYLHRFDRDYFDLIIIDECHHSVTSQHRKALDWFNGYKLGLTPVAERLDRQDISAVIGERIFELDTEEAEERKLISKTKTKVIIHASFNGDIKNKDVLLNGRTMDRKVISQKRNDHIIEYYNREIKGFCRDQGVIPKTLIFCKSVAHSKIINKLFNDNNISAVAIDSKQRRKLRDEKYDDFVTSRSRTLINVGILGEGNNIPDINSTIHLRKTSSLALMLNQIGRGTRFIEGLKESNYALFFVEAQIGKNLSTGIGEGLDYKDTSFDLYDGADPVVKDVTYQELVLKINQIMTRDYKWNKENIKERVAFFYKTRGHAGRFDLRARNGLPCPTTVEKLFGTVANLFIELGIPYRECKFNEIKPEEIMQLVLAFKKKKGNLTVNDLGQKNNLPSQKMIYKHFGTWSNFCSVIGIKSSSRKHYTREDILTNVYDYVIKHDTKHITRGKWKRAHGLPTHDAVENHFGSFGNLYIAFFDKYGIKIYDYRTRLSEGDIIWAIDSPLSLRKRAKILGVAHQVLATAILKYQGKPAHRAH